ncbi:MAG: prepilin peptidase [Candidatus Daviesbacteria bacterium]|nr:prepilin peptidase [Candidatus Daviesbacteria bacterium]
MIFGSAGFLIGIVLGSFAKALADRSLVGKSFWGRSYCSQCKKTLRWYDLFPILSFVFLQGKCRYCKKKIPLEYPITEVILGILIAYLFAQTFADFKFTVYSFQLTVLLAELVLKTFFIVILAMLCMTDMKKMLIPDRIVKPAILIGAISLLALTIYKIGYLYYYLSQSVLGRLLLPPHSDYFQRHALVIAEPLIYGVLMGLAIGGFFFCLIVLTKGKGMGGGDVKLGAFMGLMLGFPLSLLALILSFITGAVFSVGLIIAGKKHFGQTIPFGPFLVLGSLIALFWGSQIIDWYLKLGS